MIDIASQINSIEKLMKLMDKHKIDEISVDFLCIKRSKHFPPEKQVSDKELLDKHTLDSTTLSTQEYIDKIEKWITKE